MQQQLTKTLLQLHTYKQFKLTAEHANDRTEGIKQVSQVWLHCSVLGQYIHGMQRLLCIPAALQWYSLHTMAELDGALVASDLIPTPKGKELPKKPTPNKKLSHI